MHWNSKQQQEKLIILSIVWDQYNRNKNPIKKISIGELKDTLEEKTPINLTKGHKMLIFNEESTNLWFIFDKIMTLIKFIVFNITNGAIKPVFL